MDRHACMHAYTHACPVCEGLVEHTCTYVPRIYAYMHVRWAEWMHACMHVRMHACTSAWRIYVRASDDELVGGVDGHAALRHAVLKAARCMHVACMCMCACVHVHACVCVSIGGGGVRYAVVADAKRRSTTAIESSRVESSRVQSSPVQSSRVQSRSADRTKCGTVPLSHATCMRGRRPIHIHMHVHMHVHVHIHVLYIYTCMRGRRRSAGPA